MRGGFERRGNLVGVAEMPVGGNVAGHVGINLRRAGLLDGFARRRHRRQRFDIEFDRLGGVLALVDGFRDDAGDRIADEPHLVGRKRIAHRHFIVVPSRSLSGIIVLSTP